MPLYLDNDNDAILEGLQAADDFSPIVDADLAVSLVYMPAAAAIVGATNATPVVITTQAAHGLQTGDEIVVTDCEGNFAANGPFTVTVLTSTTFELDDSVGSGSYIEGGSVFRSVPGAHAVPMTYSSPRRRYRGVFPRSIPIANGTTYRRIITCSNYGVQWEADLRAEKRR